MVLVTWLTRIDLNIIGFSWVCWEAEGAFPIQGLSGSRSPGAFGPTPAPSYLGERSPQNLPIRRESSRSAPLKTAT